jgi:subtilisin family serine protease
VTLPIGILDTGVNIDHEFLAGAQVDLVTLSDTTVDPSRAVHGTAVTSLLVAPPGGRVEGLIPEAKVIVADIFGRDGDDERADVVSLLRGLDLMAERGVRVLNLSLSGPPNTVLQEAIDRLARDHGMVIVAAVGNDGPSAEPAYPAAYDDVIAVTAIDRRGRVYDDAQRGNHVDVAAPGVDLLLATSVSGARPQTGTSFAVPFVTAAAAVILSQNPDLSPQMVADRVAALTQDFGAEGRDDIFGQGILQATELCP